MFNFDVYVFVSMYKYVTPMYIQCICTRFDIHACGTMFICVISNGMNVGSINIFVIAMYIYTVQRLYVEFRCMCVRFDNFVRNGTP